MRRQLPVLVERTLADVKALQVQTAAQFESELLQTSPEVSCQVGCSHCCHHPFLVTVAEGLLMYRWLAEHGLWTASVRKRVQEARDKTLGLSLGVWLLSNIPCPLLEDGKCVAYAARPIHCRTTFSVENPQMCHPHALASGKGLVPNLESVMAFTTQVRAALKRVGVRGPLMPLGEAMLVGEEIEAGRIDIAESDRQHFEDMTRD